MTQDPKLVRTEAQAKSCYEGTNEEARPDAPAWHYLRGYADWWKEIQLLKDSPGGSSGLLTCNNPGAEKMGRDNG